MQVMTATSAYEQTERQIDNAALASNASCRNERPRTVSVSLVRESLTISVVMGAMRGHLGQVPLLNPAGYSIMRLA